MKEYFREGIEKTVSDIGKEFGSTAELVCRLNAHLVCRPLDTADVFRSRAARQLAGPNPGTLLREFIQTMDNPQPVYEAARAEGLDDTGARFRLTSLVFDAYRHAHP